MKTSVRKPEKLTRQRRMKKWANPKQEVKEPQRTPHYSLKGRGTAMRQENNTKRKKIKLVMVEFGEHLQ